MNGIDTTNRISFEKAKQITDDFVCMYLVPDRVDYPCTSMAWKRMTSLDATALTAAGKWILSVFESTEKRPLTGRSGGEYDGEKALQEAKLVGQPKGSAIYFAVDYEAQAKDMYTIYEYLMGAQSKLPDYPVGVYGSYAVVEAMAARGIKHNWQTYAWSYGKLSKHANVYQYNNGTNKFGLSTDSNYSYGGEGFWNLNGVLKSTLINNGGGNMTEWEKKAVDFVTYAQKEMGTDADGKAGPMTLAAFNDLLAVRGALAAANKKLAEIKKVLEGS